VGDSSNDRLTELLTSANRSERMGALYRRYLEAWAANTGNQLFMHFTDIGPGTQYGSWGALEGWDAASSPKYEELARFASTRRP